MAQRLPVPVKSCWYRHVLDMSSQDFPKDFSGIHLSAFFDLDKIVRCPLKNDTDADQPDSYGQTPLSVAAESGRDSVVELLLTRHDIEVDSQDWYR